MTKSEYEEVRDRPGRDEAVRRGKEILKEFTEQVRKLISIEFPEEKFDDAAFSSLVNFYFWKWFASGDSLPPIVTILATTGMASVFDNKSDGKSCFNEIVFLRLIWMAQAHYIDVISKKEALCAFPRQD